MSIRTALASILIALLVIAGAFYFFTRDEVRFESSRVFEGASAPLRDEDFEFEIVDTQETRTQGLSGRKDVPSGYGMLFVFEQKGRYGFWMKDMHVAIDILWLDDEGTVLGIEEAVSPSSYPAVFYPPEPVRYALETRAHEARARGWEEGTRIALPF